MTLKRIACSTLLLIAAFCSLSAADPETLPEWRTRQQAIDESYLDGLASIADKARASKLYELALSTTQMGLQIDPAHTAFRRKERIILRHLSTPLVIKKARSPDSVPAKEVIRALRNITAERTLLQRDTASKLVKLAERCRQQGLPLKAVDILKRAEGIDDRNEEIKKALGKEQIAPYGWLDREAQKRLKLGMVPIDGTWKSKEELLKEEETRPLTWKRAHEFRSANFLIRADLPYTKILEMAKILEAHHQHFYASVGDEIALPRVSDMAILCFARKADYTDHAKRCTRMKDGDKRIAYSSPACKAVPFEHYAVPERYVPTLHMIYNEGDDELNRSVLQHESTHGFLRSVGRDAVRTDAFDHTYISAFAIEGIATYFEPARESYLRSCKAQAKAGKLMPLKEFVVLKNPSLNRATLYAQCNGLTDFFMNAHDKKYREPFLELVYHVHARVSNPKSFEEIFGQPPAAFEDEWTAYMNALEIK